MKRKKPENIRLIAVDMDGTTLNDAKEISAATQTVLAQSMDRGIRLVISTGRSWPGVRRYVELIRPNAPVITNNGAMIIDPENGQIIKQCLLEPEDARAVYRLAKERNVSFVIWADNVLYCNRVDERTLDYGRRFGGMEPRPLGQKPSPLGQRPGTGSDLTAQERAADINPEPASESADEATGTPAGPVTESGDEEFEYLCENGVTKLLWYDTPENAERWAEEIKDYPFKNVTINTSEGGFLEFFNCNVSKGRMLEYVADMLNISIAESVAVGDGENDIPMLRAAGYAAVPENAGDKIKAYADEIISSNNDEGVARFLSQQFAQNR